MLKVDVLDCVDVYKVDGAGDVAFEEGFLVGVDSCIGDVEAPVTAVEREVI